MALSNLALAGIGLGTAAVVVVAAKRKIAAKKAKRRGLKDLKTKPVAPVSTADNHPICQKYPGGQWLEGAGQLAGWPLDSPGWSDADVVMAQAAVNEAVSGVPPWNSISEARQITFELTRKIIKKWCPSLDLPSARYNVKAYLDESVPLMWLWGSLDTMLWNQIVGDPGGGSN